MSCRASTMTAFVAVLALGVGIVATEGQAGFGNALPPSITQPGWGESPDPAPTDEQAAARCMERFRSYDRRTGTYLGYDGYRHRCP